MLSNLRNFVTQIWSSKSKEKAKIAAHYFNLKPQNNTDQSYQSLLNRLILTNYMQKEST